MKVLIAEDDPASRFVLATRLRRMGHEVLVARDGEEAWTMFQRDHPRLVITDWMMPNMNGLDLCRNIRNVERSNYTYVIMLTALHGRSNYLEGMEAGADDFLTKPFDPEGLQARLRAAERIVSLQIEASRLEGLLPICVYCKKIRDGQQQWQQLEEYVGQKTETAFTPTLCPTCASKAS
jgi:sigma-B regulation protein RsbU (phosphoserine phosphatase)